ncbi:MAG TPA: response regulator transcription factor [Candidatus Acidoferrales bacterium]|nr:response regulator transcription factor [Candidatus Acidoferrales bacterium]
MPFRILVVDDHEIVRMGIRTLFAQRPDWLICGEADDGRAAVAEVMKSRPDVVILDLLLQGDMSGFDTAAQIRDAAPSCKIVFFSLHDVPATARMAGADAFVSKASGVRELVATIDRLTAENASNDLSSQRRAAAS